MGASRQVETISATSTKWGFDGFFFICQDGSGNVPEDKRIRKAGAFEYWKVDDGRVK